MSTEGGSINVGGVNFTIGIDLATFEANLAKAEEIAKVRAKRIQEALNKKTTDGGTTGASGPGSAEQIQQIIVQQKRSTKPPTESIQLPPTPPTIYLTQEVVVTRHLRVVDKTGLSDQISDIPVAGKGPAFESGGGGSNGGTESSEEAATPYTPSLAFARMQASRQSDQSRLYNFHARQGALRRRLQRERSLYDPLSQARQEARAREEGSPYFDLKSGRLVGNLPAQETAPEELEGPSIAEQMAANEAEDATRLATLRSARIARQSAQGPVRAAPTTTFRQRQQSREELARQLDVNNANIQNPELPAQNLVDELTQREAAYKAPTQLPPQQLPIAPVQRQFAQANIAAPQQSSRAAAATSGQKSAADTIYGHYIDRGMSHEEAVQEAERITGQKPSAQAPPAPPPKAPSGNRGGSGGNGSRGGSINPFAREFSPVGLARIAGGFLGVNLGINIAAGAARDLHQAIAAVVESAVQLEQSGRNIGTAFGATGSVLTGAATAFANNPTTKGTTAEFQGAAASAAPLAAQFDLSKGQILDLVTAEGQLARLHGIELPAASQILQSVLRGNVDAGQQLDLELTNQYGVLKNVGLTWDQLVQAQGPAAARATLLAQVQADVNRQMQNSTATIDPTVAALDRLSKAWDKAKSSAASYTAPVVGGIANAAAGLLENPGGIANTVASKAIQIAPTIAPAIPFIGPFIGPAINVAQAGLQAKQESDVRQEELKRRAAAVDQNAPAFDPENPSTDFQVYQRAKVDTKTGKVFGSEFAIPTPGQLRTMSTSLATQQQSDAGVQAALAQSKIDVLSATADQRKLAVQGDINNLLSQRINLQDQLAPMLISEQAIQNNIAVITRENLDLTRNKLIAQQAALGPQEQVAGFDFARNQANARIGLSISQSVAGQKPTFDIGQQVNTILQNSAILNPNVAQANVNNVEGQRGVQVAGFAQQEDVLQKQINAIPDMQQLQDLQLDNINNIKLQIAAVDSQSAAIDRYLQAQTLEGSIQEALIGAELALIDARTKGAQATGQIAQNTIDESAGRIPPVSVIVNLGGLTVGSDEQDLLNKIQNATSAGVIDGLARGASLNPPRVDPNTAGGR